MAHGRYRVRGRRDLGLDEAPIFGACDPCLSKDTQKTGQLSLSALHPLSDNGNAVSALMMRLTARV